MFCRNSSHFERTMTMAWFTIWFNELEESTFAIKNTRLLSELAYRRVVLLCQKPKNRSKLINSSNFNSEITIICVSKSILFNWGLTFLSRLRANVHAAFNRIAHIRLFGQRTTQSVSYTLALIAFDAINFRGTEYRIHGHRIKKRARFTFERSANDHFPLTKLSPHTEDDRMYKYRSLRVVLCRMDSYLFLTSSVVMVAESQLT